MGHRANLVVLRNGRWRLYYDHWCATRLDSDLFWGPDLAVDFIEQREENEGWLDEVWCEGAALVDLDHRVLLFFGGDDLRHDIPLRRAHLDLMTENWPGWKILWAYQGILSIAEYLSLDVAQWPVRSKTFRDKRFFRAADVPEWNTILLTIARDRTLTALQVSGYIDCLVSGLAAHDDVAGALSAKPLVWEGDFPTGGLHLDFDRKTLSYWGADIWSRHDQVLAAWSGWQAEFFFDQFERHLALVGEHVQVAYSSQPDLHKAILAQLKASLTSAPPKNLARASAERWAAEGHGRRVELNPASDIVRAPAGNAARKMEILQNISRRLKST